MGDRPLIKGDRVRLKHGEEALGRVREAGPEQSRVHWDGERHPVIHSNTDLARVVERAKSKRRLKDG